MPVNLTIKLVNLPTTLFVLCHLDLQYRLFERLPSDSATLTPYTRTTKTLLISRFQVETLYAIPPKWISLTSCMLCCRE